jgi:hypothetical protein
MNAGWIYTTLDDEGNRERQGEKQCAKGKIITLRGAARVIIQVQGWIETFRGQAQLDH